MIYFIIYIRIDSNVLSFSLEIPGFCFSNDCEVDDPQPPVVTRVIGGSRTQHYRGP